MDNLNATLSARPDAGAKYTLEAGPQAIGLGEERDGLIFIPRNAGGPLPLLILLHGAGGKASHMLVPFRDLAEKTQTALLIPESRRKTWDIILGGFGPDVKFINQSMQKLFNEVPINPQKMAIAGFSDGASYALSLGITNGDLFSHILAYSPGFMAPPMRRDSPPVFISHGTHDNVLPIEHCSRRLVPLLQDGGMEVNYNEFAGGHTMPEDLVKSSFEWFLGSQDTEIQSSRVPVNEREIRNT